MKKRYNSKVLVFIVGFLLSLTSLAVKTDTSFSHSKLFSDIENSLAKSDFTTAVGLLEVGGIEVKGIEKKISAFEKIKSKVQGDTLDSMEHILNRLRDEGESTEMESVLATLRRGEVKNNLSLVEEELVKSKVIVSKNTIIGAFERDTFTLKLNDLIIDIKEALLLGANLKKEIISLVGKDSSRLLSNNGQSVNQRGETSYLSYIIFLVLLASVVALYMMVTKLKRKNFELENRDWGSYIRKKAFKSQVETYQTLSDVGAVVIDTNEKILSMNKCFREMFASDIVNDEKWGEFFTRNFKRERSLKGTFSVYKYMRDVTSDYMIQFSKPDAQGRKSCFIIKFDVGFLTKLGKDREEDLEKIKVNILDVIDDVIAKENSFKDKNFLDLRDVDYANDLYIYMPELQARTIFEKSLKALLAVQSIKNSSQRAVLNVKRKDKNLIFTAILPGIHLDVRDFSKEVSKNVSLNNMMKEIEEIESSYGVTSVWKNTMRDSGRAVSFEMMISDLENVKVEQWEYAL